MFKTGCIICGNELIYQNKSDRLKCYFCKKINDANVKCKNGHFICDNCHSLSANDLIKEFCIKSESKNPIEMALILMRNPKIKIHGPEHHFLVPAVLLSAYYNIKNDNEKKVEKIKEAERRVKNLLGGFCGFYGACAAGISTGVFISIITDATPLSTNEWKQSNMMTSKSLRSIANIGGPRCCKRNSFLSILEAIQFLEASFNISIDFNKNIKCEFSSLNKECLKSKCPFWF